MLSSSERDGLCRESQSDGHRYIVIHIQGLLVVYDVGVLELDLLHLGIFIGLLVDNLAFDGLELAINHSLDRRGVFCRLDGHDDTPSSDAGRGLTLTIG